MCDHYKAIATSRVILNNETPLGLKIWFVQALDTKGNAPNIDFVRDTGVIIGATNGNGPAVLSIGPCKGGGFERPIQANICKGTVKLIGDTEIDVTLPEKRSDPTPYFNECDWDLTVDDAGNVSAH
jgi:hypothetical protein